MCVYIFYLPQGSTERGNGERRFHFGICVPTSIGLRVETTKEKLQSYDNRFAEQIDKRTLTASRRQCSPLTHTNTHVPPPRE